MSGTIKTDAALQAEDATGQPLGSIKAVNLLDIIVSETANIAAAVALCAKTPAIFTVYTASGPLALTDDEAIINSSSNLTMTLANPSGPQILRIKRYGTGTVTVTGSFDGIAGQSLQMNSPGGKEKALIEYCPLLSTWIVG